jgi:hypothetical protein
MLEQDTSVISTVIKSVEITIYMYTIYMFDNIHFSKKRKMGMKYIENNYACFACKSN